MTKSPLLASLFATGLVASASCSSSSDETPAATDAAEPDERPPTPPEWDRAVTRIPEATAAASRAASLRAVSDLSSRHPASAVLVLPRTSITASMTSAGPDTTRVSWQSLGGGLVRCLASARSWSGGVFAQASTVAFARVGLDSGATTGTLRFRWLTGWWWDALP